MATLFWVFGIFADFSSIFWRIKSVQFAGDFPVFIGVKMGINLQSGLARPRQPVLSRPRTALIQKERDPVQGYPLSFYDSSGNEICSSRIISF